MSKEAGFVVPSEHHYAPSAPPSYEEAIQQATMPMPLPYAVSQPAPPMAPQYSLPPPHYPPPQPYPTQGTQTTPVTGPRVSVGRERCTMRCPSCHATILTETTEEAHGLAHACCCLLFFIGCCLCSCLPYCMDSCKTVTHKCPNCKANLGTFNPY